MPCRLGGFAFVEGLRGIDLFDVGEACLDDMAGFVVGRQMVKGLRDEVKWFSIGKKREKDDAISPQNSMPGSGHSRC